MIEPEHPELPVGRQCELLGISRSAYYAHPSPRRNDELTIMHEIDRVYTAYPFYGYRRITQQLGRDGWQINHKRVARLMREMGLVSLAPGPCTSKPHPEHKVYPYLLRGEGIVRSDQVWCADITYVPMRTGYMYLMAILDWCSRFVLAWRLSNTLDVGFCLDALDEALSHGRPAIFNTDQGAQFTSDAFTGRLLAAGVQVSMDGRGRAYDNIIIERFWRNVKYEYLYLHSVETGRELHQGVHDYMEFYNHRRIHEALDYATPREAYQKESAA